MHTMRHTPHWFHPRPVLLAVLAIAAIYAVVWLGLRATAQLPAASAPPSVEAVSVAGPQVAMRSAAEYATQMARLRDLNTSGDPALDAVARPVAMRSAAEYASQMARLRDLNTSGDPALDAVARPVAMRSAAEYATQMARLRDLNTSGDPALDGGVMPLRAPGQRTGPF